MDLEAVNRGEPPLRARKNFNLDDLEQLEQGQSLEPDSEEKIQYEQSLNKYKVTVTVLASIIAVLVLLVIFLFTLK